MGFLGFITVEPVVLFGSFGYYVEQTMVQDLVFTKRCMEIMNATSAKMCSASQSENNTLLSQILSEQSALMSTYFTLYGLVSIPMCFFIGSWSDVYGRKKPLVFPFVLFIVSQICLLLSSYFININLIGLIYVSAALDGMLGGQTGILIIVFGYMSDITNDSNRTKRNVILESMWYVGGCLGFLFTAAMQFVPVRKFEICFTFLIAMHCMTILYIIFRIKETRKLDDVQNVQVLSFKHVIECLQTGFKKRSVKAVRLILLFNILAVALYSCSYAIQNNLTYPLLKRDPLKWDTEMYSMYSSSILITSGLGLVIALPLVLTCCGRHLKDSYIISFGSIFKSSGLIILALATETWQVFITSAIFICSDFAMPSIRSLSSKLVEDNEKGKVLSLIGATQNIFNCIGSSVFGSIFSLWPSIPGLVFYMAGFMYMVVGISHLLVGFWLEPKRDYSRFVDENSNKTNALNPGDSSAEP